MPTLETELGVAVILAVTAGALLVNNKSSGDDTEFNTLLLMSVLLHSLIPTLWTLSTALRLTESYPRLRVPPLRSYWAGAFHALGTLSLTTALGTFVALFLHTSGLTIQPPLTLWRRLVPVAVVVDNDAWATEGDALIVLALYAAAVATALRTKQREMDPETTTAVMPRGKLASNARVAHGWVARGHRVRFWWMYGVANWVRSGGDSTGARGWYDMNWARHWKTEPVAEAGERMTTLEEMGHGEVVQLRAEFWLVLVLYGLGNGVFLRLFWNILQ